MELTGVTFMTIRNLSGGLPVRESFSIVIRAIHFGWMRPGGGKSG